MQCASKCVQAKRHHYCACMTNADDRAGIHQATRPSINNSSVDLNMLPFLRAEVELLYRYISAQPPLCGRSHHSSPGREKTRSREKNVHHFGAENCAVCSGQDGIAAVRAVSLCWGHSCGKLVSRGTDVCCSAFLSLLSLALECQSNVSEGPGVF